MLDTLNVGKQISIDREPHIKNDATNAQERTVKDHTATSLLTLDAKEHFLCQVATRTAADAAPIQNDGCGLNTFDIGQVMICRFNVGITMFLTRLKGPPLHFVGNIGQTIASVVVRHDVDLQQARQLLQILVEHPQVFGIAMAVQYRKATGELIDVEGGDATSQTSLQPKHLGAGYGSWFLRRLEEECADDISHRSSRGLCCIRLVHETNRITQAINYEVVPARTSTTNFLQWNF